MSSIMEAARNRFVTLDALLGADEGGARNMRGHDDCAINHHARDEHQSPQGSASEKKCGLKPAEARKHGEVWLGVKRVAVSSTVILD